jgi:hypothetical protein
MDWHNLVKTRHIVSGGFMERRVLCAAVVAAAVSVCGTVVTHAAVILNDTFGSSTLNAAVPTAPTATSTSYQLMSSKAWTPAPSITSGHLTFGIAKTSSGHIETQALFATAPVSLANVGDYIDLTITFTNTIGLDSQGGHIAFGMYNTSQVQPVAGGLNGTAVSGNTSNATGGVQNWIGYPSRIAYTGGNSRIGLRPAQPGTNNTSQDLLVEGSASQSYTGNINLASAASTLVLTDTNVYTEYLKYTLTAAGTMQIETSLYGGPTATGSPLFTQTATATGGNFVASSFDGLAMGWRSTGNVTATTVDINAITVSTNVAVPEPASLGLLAVGALTMIRRRK